MKGMRLAIISTHPIQYNAPLFGLLAQNTDFKIKVFYTLGIDSSEFTDPGFKKTIKWDIPLLHGYDYTFVKNKSASPSTSSFWGIYNPSLIQEIELFDATHILIYGWSFHSHLNVLRYFHKKIKIFFRGDSTLLDEKPGFKTMFRRLALYWVYRHIDKALYVGTHNKKYFLKHGLSVSNLIFAPHAIDNSRFRNDNLYATQAYQLRNRLIGNTDKIVFLFIGKFEKKKNPLLLIKAFKQLDPLQCTLLMVGNGPLEQELIKESVGCANIKFLPFQNQTQMPIVYRTADVLILPSDGPGETWGLCINEAMACGLAVIASTKVGCAVDLVHPGINGYIFEAGDFEDLREKLELITIKTKEELKAMGATSRSIIENWSYDHICTAINTLIKE